MSECVELLACRVGVLGSAELEALFEELTTSQWRRLTPDLLAGWAHALASTVL